MKIGENIKHYRMQNRMEQKELAEKLHISNKTVSSWECGRTEPNIGMLEALADVFGISKADLIDGSAYVMEIERKPSDTAAVRRLLEYSQTLNDKGIEKLFERAEELRQMGYVKEGDHDDD